MKKTVTVQKGSNGFEIDFSDTFTSPLKIIEGGVLESDKSPHEGKRPFGGSYAKQRNPFSTRGEFKEYTLKFDNNIIIVEEEIRKFTQVDLENVGFSFQISRNETGEYLVEIDNLDQIPEDLKKNIGDFFHNLMPLCEEIDW